MGRDRTPVPDPGGGAERASPSLVAVGQRGQPIIPPSSRTIATTQERGVVSPPSGK